MDEMLSDDRLAKAALTDVDAFAMLYRRHLHRVYSYLLSRVGNVQDAQDLTSQTFIAALKGLRIYEPRGMFGSWLLGIAKRKASDHFRNHQPVVSVETISTAADQNRSLDDRIVERLQMHVIAAQLEKLNPERAEVLRLRFFGELKLREIAEVMGKSEGAVKMLLARALDDIRSLLALEETVG